MAFFVYCTGHGLAQKAVGAPLAFGAELLPLLFAQATVMEGPEGFKDVGGVGALPPSVHVKN